MAVPLSFLQAPEPVLPKSLMDIGIRDDSGGRVPLTDCGGLFRPQMVHVHFRNLEEELCGYISQAKLVVGCVAWLTSEPVLDALANIPNGVAIVVQKEDFLRPDIAANKGWAARIRKMYDRLPSPPERNCFEALQGLSAASDPGVQPVRCMGNHNRERLPAMPRMHNKFLVFCDYRRPMCRHCHVEDESGNPVFVATCCDCCPRIEIVPYAVWTGSFNLTKNATMSFENAVYVSNVEVAQAYYDEWAQIMALSEPLDWETPWCAPEWRIGT